MIDWWTPPSRSIVLFVPFWFLYDRQKSSGDEGKGFVCSQASCAHRVSLSEVSQRLQEIRVGLEKAVDLMERERPGGCGKTKSKCRFSDVSLLFILTVFCNICMLDFSPQMRLWGCWNWPRVSLDWSWQRRTRYRASWPMQQPEHMLQRVGMMMHEFCDAPLMFCVVKATFHH